jgi:hypothetical protein
MRHEDLSKWLKETGAARIALYSNLSDEVAVLFDEWRDKVLTALQNDVTTALEAQNLYYLARDGSDEQKDVLKLWKASVYTPAEARELYHVTSSPEELEEVVLLWAEKTRSVLAKIHTAVEAEALHKVTRAGSPEEQEVVEKWETLVKTPAEATAFQQATGLTPQKTQGLLRRSAMHR